MQDSLVAQIGMFAHPALIAGSDFYYDRPGREERSEFSAAKQYGTYGRAKTFVQRSWISCENGRLVCR
jgi:hypothetical protein